jgi:microcystin-dependent protein
MPSDQLLGEIRVFGGTYEPLGFVFCDGDELDIVDNPGLFALLGTSFGGDGITTFAVPDLRGRAPIHKSADFLVGESGGTESVTLTAQQIPAHTHPLTAATNLASISAPQGTLLAESSQINMYVADDPSVSMAPTSISPVGGSQPHENMQPFLAMNFIIATDAGATTGPYTGELRLFPYVGLNPPSGWAWCEGQLLPLSQNTALFAILGTFYGGDGKSTFALPDLQGAIPIGEGQGFGLSERFVGEMSGIETVTLLDSEMPAHTHVLRASPDPADIATPQPGESIARAVGGQSYHTNTSQNLVAMAPQALPPTGGDLPHTNLQPYLTLRWAIALQGNFPTQA